MKDRLVSNDGKSSIKSSPTQLSDSRSMRQEVSGPAAPKRLLPEASIPGHRFGKFAISPPQPVSNRKTAERGFRTTLERAPVQRKSNSAAHEQSAQVHEAARSGISGPGQALPYLARIQKSFGRHDVSQVVAHTDSVAAEGSRAMGAEAFTVGSHVAFTGAPTLHTASHEAAHVVQQRAGVHLKGGVGQVGDPYERHADAVADRVVQGLSSESLLDAGAGTPPGQEYDGTPGTAPQGETASVNVQRKVGMEFETCLPVRKKEGKEEKTLGYKTKVLTTTKGWYLEADSSNLEFVTSPFIKKNQLKVAVLSIADWMEKLENKFRSSTESKTDKKAEIPYKTINEIDPAAGAVQGNYYIKLDKISDGHLEANPQATGGLTLDKILDLFNSVLNIKLEHLIKPSDSKDKPKEENNVKDKKDESDSDESDNDEPDNDKYALGGANSFHQDVLALVEEQTQKFIKELTAPTENPKDKADTKEAKSKSKSKTKEIAVPEHGYKKLAGLIALVRSYVLGAEVFRLHTKKPIRIPYSKVIAPLMSRVDFHQLYLLLEKDEQQLFTPEFVMQDLALDELTIPAGFGKPKPGSGELTQYGPTRREWIQSIIKGPIDKMSEGGKTSVADRNYKTSGTADSMGAMHKPDQDFSGKNRLAVIELRRLPRDQHYKHWWKTSDVIFNVFRGLDPTLVDDAKD